MEKLDGKTFDIVSDNIKKLEELFPEIVTEGKVDVDKLALLFDKNRNEDTDASKDGEERYEFTWKGKKEAIRMAQKQTTGTLRPCREESVNFDETQNLYIEGDNLEVLRALQSSYRGKVKMIYIDPPYNTGKDFVYKDNFNDNIKNYKEMMNESYKTNTDASGRFHTNWLNMIYPRLKLAKNLLSEDGVIFISLNDKEIHNMRKICDEVFGSDNFIANFIWNTDGHTDNQYDVKVNHEYICLYCKQKLNSNLGFVVDPNTREESNLWKGFAENSITKNGQANPPSEVILPKGFPCKIEKGIIKSNIPEDNFFEEVQAQGYITRQITDKYNTSYPIRFSDMVINDKKLENNVKVYTGWANLNKLKSFIDNGFNPIVDSDGSEISFYISPNGVIYYYKKRSKARNILSVLRNMGTTEQMRSELENNDVFFTYPKPINLIKYIMQIGLINNEELVLDFFSGSSTTAHAVMQLNAEDRGNRKFIMVQLPEETEEKSEAYKAGYKNICEIGKERIRIAVKKIVEENKDKEVIEYLDIGFKVFKLDTTNIKEWDDTIQDTEEIKQMAMALDNPIKEDRSQEDVIYEILLKYGVDLTMPIEEIEIMGSKVYSVGFGYLMICLEEDINLDLIEAIGEQKPNRVVLYDNGLDNESKTNGERILKELGVKDIRTI